MIVTRSSWRAMRLPRCQDTDATSHTPSEAVAAFAAATASPALPDTADDAILLAMRSTERGRVVRTDCVALLHRVPTISGVIPMSAAVAHAFPALQFEYFAIPERGTLRAAQAIFAKGRVVEPWHHAQSREEVAEIAARRWNESVSRADVPPHERGR